MADPRTPRRASAADPTPTAPGAAPAVAGRSRKAAPVPVPARRALLRAAAALAAAPAAGVASTARAAQGAPARGRPFAFALIGDLPYSEAGEADVAALLAALDAEPLEFVLHVGDIKAGTESCTDALLARRHALFARGAHPLVMLPGDNEWTDCRRALAGGHDPLERLDALRALFWSTPSPLGARGDAARVALAFERQPGQPENVRWRVGAVRFVALHVVGSGNARDGFEGSRAAFAARRDRNRAWLADTVRRALDERADALAIAAHANPGFERAPRPGFVDWIEDLRAAADAFPRPILLLHGDTHRFRVDRPLTDRTGRAYAHVTRVESFGWPFTSSWVRIAYDPDDPARFRVGVRELAVAGRGP
jgi:hypothetical protein